MNRLPATIVQVEVHGSVALVEAAVGTRRFTSMLVGAGEDIGDWHAGMPVTLLFQETEVSLARNLSGMLSIRNRLPAQISAIDMGKLMTRVTLAFEGHDIDAIITTRSALALGLSVGDAVEGLVKSNEMTVVPGVAT